MVSELVVFVLLYFVIIVSKLLSLHNDLQHSKYNNYIKINLKI